MCGRQLYVKSGRDNAVEERAGVVASLSSPCARMREFLLMARTRLRLKGKNGLYPTLISSFLLSLNHGVKFELDGWVSAAYVNMAVQLQWKDARAIRPSRGRVSTPLV